PRAGKAEGRVRWAWAGSYAGPSLAEVRSRKGPEPGRADEGAGSVRIDDHPGGPGMVKSIKVTVRPAEAGMVLVLVAVFVVLLMGFMALVVDGGHAFETQTRCQSTADAAALAAAGKLPDQTGAKSTALSYATKNMDPALHGAVVGSSDV